MQTKAKRVAKAKRRTRFVSVDLGENRTVHCKAYIQPTLDVAVRRFQTECLDKSGKEITYSEAVRRLLVVGLWTSFGITLDLINATFEFDDLDFNP